MVAWAGSTERTDAMSEDQRKNDERLLARAEEALTQIKVSQGLSEPHAAVLAALRIRLKGDRGGSLEDLLAASEDDAGPKLDDLFSQPEEPKRSLDDLLG
jgi:hypothetical protein